MSTKNNSSSTKAEEIIEQAKNIIGKYQGRTLRVMEVCGTHTHEIFRLGIRSVVEPKIKLVSGPGCPVCVTGSAFIDEARFLAETAGVTVCTFGDLVRVPGTNGSLLDSQSKGGNVEIVYSPLDAVTFAQEHPDQEVVFLSVGFETTTPACCLALRQAQNYGLKNFSLLTANKTMDEVYKNLAGMADAYLYPGHVCAVTGTHKLADLAKTKNMGGQGISGIVTGFKAEEILAALAVIVQKIDLGQPFFANCYKSVVREEGNRAAQEIIAEYMEPCDALWRGLGILPRSGLKLRMQFSAYDARQKFQLPSMAEKVPSGCRCGEVLRGTIEPSECKLFGTICKPLTPVGACMVSQEGTCAAYYKYGREWL